MRHTSKLKPHKLVAIDGSTDAQLPVRKADATEGHSRYLLKNIAPEYC